MHKYLTYTNQMLAQDETNNDEEVQNALARPELLPSFHLMFTQPQHVATALYDVSRYLFPEHLATFRLVHTAI